jgi:SPP1 gp7 family putative phage head morphogenesis protein
MAKRRRLRNRKRAPAWLFPTVPERRFEKALRKILPEKLKALVEERVLPRIPTLVREADQLRPRPTSRLDAWPDEVRQLREELKIQLEDAPAQVQQSAQAIAVDVSQVNRNQWGRIQRSLVGVELGVGEPWLANQMASFTAQNTSLITKLSEDSIANIEGAIQRGLQAGERVGAIRERVLDQVNVSFKRAQLIARDQVAKFNSQLTQNRQESIGVTKYIWRTSRDERVRGRPGGKYASARPTHWALEGKMCRWDDATVYSDDGGETWKKRSSIGAVELHPGMDYQCRCTAEPVLDELLGEENF